MAKESKLIRAFLERAAESLASARLLLNSSFYDDAVSRAYYAMYYAAKAALESIGVETRSHAGVINQFGLHFITKGQLDSQYGSMLTQAFQARHSSDYDVQVNTRPVVAESVVANAEQFVAKIKELLGKMP